MTSRPLIQLEPGNMQIAFVYHPNASSDVISGLITLNDLIVPLTNPFVGGMHLLFVSLFMAIQVLDRQLICIASSSYL